jgi:hypothetical protein
VIAALVSGLALTASALHGAGAAAAATRPPAAIAASPARVVLPRPSAERVVRVTNPGRLAVLVDAAPAGFALDLRGRPRIVALPAAARWIAVAPQRHVLEPGGTTTFTVRAARPRRSGPGDHPSLVLLTAVPAKRVAGVPVRMQVGVVVMLRVPGAIVHRLDVPAVRVRHRPRGDTRVVEISIANRGNVAEQVGARRLVVTLLRRGTVVSRLLPKARELLPRSRAVAELPYRGLVRGWVQARVDLIRPSPGVKVLRRSFRIRL